MSWKRRYPKPKTPYSDVLVRLAEEKRQRRRERNLMLRATGHIAYSSYQRA